MNVRTVALAGALAIVACAAAETGSEQAPPKQLPHILLLFTDEQDGRTLDPSHPYSSIVATPTFDKLASTGSNFVRTYTPAPQCVPGRSATFTSLHSHRSLAWNNGQGIAADAKTGKLDADCVKDYSQKTCQTWADAQAKYVHTTLDRAVEDIGWNVTLIGKVDVGATILERFPLAWADGWHSGPSASILTRGADIRRPTKGTPISLVDWNKPNGSFPNDWITIENTVHVLNNFDSIYKPGERVFLYSSVLTPHPPMHTSSKWLDRVNQSHLRAHMPVWNDWANFHPFDSYMSISKNFADPSYTEDYLFNVSESYFSDVAIADDMHGQVMAALEASPAANNTWVIFISDHGEMHCEARQVWKNSLREASARVPLVITGPGIKQQLVTSYTSLLDVMPTIIELGGGTVPPGLDGQSLVPLLFEDEATARKYGVTWSPREAFDAERPVYSQYHSNMGNTGSFMLATRVNGAEMKLITFGNTMPWFNESAYHPQLFNLTADPWELNDLSASNPALTATLVAQLEAFFGGTQDIDVQVKVNDQGLFKEYFEDVYNPTELRKKLASTYQGFDDADMAQINLFMETTPTAPAQ